MDNDVLIVGAGPTGLVLALWLAKLGVDVRIIDKTLAPGTTSRALAVQARTLELYRQLDMAGTVVARGHKVAAVNLWVKGKAAARLAFETVGADLTPYAFLQIFPQDEHERLLIERLGDLGVSVERQTELVAYTDEGGPSSRASATSKGASRSARRASSPAATAPLGRAPNDGRRVPRRNLSADLLCRRCRRQRSRSRWRAAHRSRRSRFPRGLPVGRAGRARLIGTVRDERADHADTLRFEDVSDRAITNLKVKVGNVNWFSTYHVHHRVTEHFRKGRAFLLGDAAHIHSPAGGQGMNTGIGDAINLAWKLEAVLARHAPDSLLDSYELERIGFARRLVSTTDRVFTLATADGAIADIVRTRVAPVLFPAAISFEAVREFIFRTVSQITLNYRGGPLSAGVAGHVHGGDRLPWAAIDGSDNFASLAAMTWQVHVYGTARADLIAWCTDNDVSLHTFDWQSGYEAAGLGRNALYLLDPIPTSRWPTLPGRPPHCNATLLTEGCNRSPVNRVIVPGLSNGTRRLMTSWVVATPWHPAARERARATDHNRELKRRPETRLGPAA